MRISLFAAEPDIVEAALYYVLNSDVVSKPQKREMMVRLATMKQTLACAPCACESCQLRSTCEAQVVDIMAGSA